MKLDDVKLGKLEADDPQIEPMRKAYFEMIAQPEQKETAGKWLGAFKGGKLIGCLCIQDFGTDRYVQQMFTKKGALGRLALEKFTQFFKVVKDKPLWLTVRDPKLDEYFASQGAKDMGRLRMYEAQ